MGLLWPVWTDASSAKDIDVGDNYIRSAYVEGICTRSTYTKSTCIEDTYLGSTCIRDIYINDTYTKSTYTEVLV